MPARLSSMELSDPIAPESHPGADNATNRRKSARTRQKPVLLQNDVNASRSSNVNGKRKRGDNEGGGAIDSGHDLLGEDDSPSESDGDPDEEELKEKKRAPRAKRAQGKPAAKKPKTTGIRTASLPVRPAINGSKKTPRPKKPQAASKKPVLDDETGLYGMLIPSWYLTIWLLTSR